MLLVAKSSVGNFSDTQHDGCQKILANGELFKDLKSKVELIELRFRTNISAIEGIAFKLRKKNVFRFPKCGLDAAS